MNVGFKHTPIIIKMIKYCIPVESGETLSKSGIKINFSTIY